MLSSRDVASELVVDYISYKLGQRGFAWRADPVAPPDRADGADLADGGGGGGGGLDGGGALGGGAADAVVGGVGEVGNNHQRHLNHSNHHSNHSNHRSHRSHSHRHHLGDVDPVQRAMRASGDEFERRYRSAFAQLPAQLQVSQATLRARFSDVLDELFRDGVNWGRVVAFFAFGGALCAECVDKELPGLVSSVATWMTSYLEDRLLWWIDDNGGWDAFVQLYGNGVGTDAARWGDTMWPSLQTVIGVAAVGACLTFGALFTQK
ncbi:bcl-2-like protein 2 [Petromyzon marinus]|uniref:Bcl-2-like protein 2 n=1 Tax=Petromyzon marinus TaxID=7757 RepID=A0AAJ7WXA8_PETMA|nr:bcl-2-like protein 2 [Petromyzon marinus]